MRQCCRQDAEAQPQLRWEQWPYHHAAAAEKNAQSGNDFIGIGKNTSANQLMTMPMGMRMPMGNAGADAHGDAGADADADADAAEDLVERFVIWVTK